MSKKSKYRQKNSQASTISKVYTKNSFTKITEQKQTKFIEFVNSTKYLAMIDNDSLHYKHLDKLMNSDFQISIKKMAQDFYYLLQINDDLFWKQLQQNQSLRYALESCLTIFPRQKYEMYINKIQEQEHKENQQEDYSMNQNYRKYEILLQYTLFIYYRIVNTANQKRSEVLYQQWVFDMPKLLDLIAIYTPSNPTIVKNIINKLFEIKPAYYDDWNDLINSVYKTWFNDVFKQLQFQFNYHNKRSSAFNNQKKSFLQNLIKTLLKVFEHCTFFIDVFNYFPKKCVYMLVTDQDIIEKNLSVYVRYMESIRQRWTIQTADLKRKILPIFEQIRQTFITMFLTYFDILDKIFKDQTAGQSYKENAKQCIILFAHCLDSARKKKNKYLLQLFEICFKESPFRNIFAVPVKIQLEPQEKADIKAALNYQITIKKPIIQKFNHFDFIQMTISGIPSYKDWKSTIQNLQKDKEFIKSKQSNNNFYIKQYDDEPQEEDIPYYRLPNFWEQKGLKPYQQKPQQILQTHEISVVYKKTKYKLKQQQNITMTMIDNHNNFKKKPLQQFSLIENQDLTLPMNDNFVGESHFLDLDFNPNNDYQQNSGLLILDDSQDFLQQLEAQQKMLKRKSKTKNHYETKKQDINISMSYFSQKKEQKMQQISLTTISIVQKNDEKISKKNNKKKKNKKKMQSNVQKQVKNQSFILDGLSNQNITMTMIYQ